MIGKLEKSHPYSLFTKNHIDDKNSLTNYYVEIKSNIYKNKNSAIIWLFDTKDTGCDGLK